MTDTPITTSLPPIYPHSLFWEEWEKIRKEYYEAKNKQDEAKRFDELHQEIMLLQRLVEKAFVYIQELQNNVATNK